MSESPFADLAAKLGITLTDPSEPLAVEGPVLQACGEETADGKHCPGNLRLTDQDGPIWTVECDLCHFTAGLPARIADPTIGRQLRHRRAGFPEQFAGKPFEQTADSAPARNALRDWLREDDPRLEHKDRLRKLIPAPAIWGDIGRGKTHLLTAVCEQLVDRGLKVMFVTSRSLLHDLQQFENEAARSTVWHRAIHVDVLALDDLGAERMTPWRHEQLAEVVHERDATRPMLVATNWPPAAWIDVMDERTASRLRGNTFGVELKGEDRRQTRLDVPSQTKEQVHG